MNTTFKIGDKVSFLNEKRTGTVINVLSNFRLLVTTEDGFDVSVSANELVPLTERSTYVIDSRKMREKDEQEVQVPKLERDEVWEVDLHLTDILDTGRELTDHEKLKAQLSHFNKCMHAAMAHRIKKMIFIHGVGKGTLKQELLHALKEYDRTRSYDAPFKKYGFGAMVVEFF